MNFLELKISMIDLIKIDIIHENSGCTLVTVLKKTLRKTLPQNIALNDNIWFYVDKEEAKYLVPKPLVKVGNTK